jgi:hypothetical protein
MHAAVLLDQRAFRPAFGPAGAGLLASLCKRLPLGANFAVCQMICLVKNRQVTITLQSLRIRRLTVVSRSDKSPFQKVPRNESIAIATPRIRRRVAQ